MTKAQAELKKLEAEAKSAEALAALNEALARYNRALAKKATADAKRAEIETEKAIDKYAEENAADDAYRIYNFTEQVGADSVRKCMKVLAVWSRVDEGCDIELVFTSPGGSVIHGMALYDYIQSLRRAGHRITTKSRGYAASMAGILLQAGDLRVMERESWLLIHRGSAMVGGDMHQIEDTVEWFKKIDERILNIFYERSRGAPKAMSKRALAAAFDRKDWWLSSDDAYDRGFCDEVQ